MVENARRKRRSKHFYRLVVDPNDRETGPQRSLNNGTVWWGNVIVVVGKCNCRRSERNPLSAGLVDRGRECGRGSLWSITRGTEAIKALLSPWPVERPANWTARVNAPLTTKESDRVRVSIERGQPYGEEEAGAGNGKRFWAGADRSSGRPPTESALIANRGDKLITRIGFHLAVRLTDRPIAALFPSCFHPHLAVRLTDKPIASLFPSLCNKATLRMPSSTPARFLGELHRSPYRCGRLSGRYTGVRRRFGQRHRL